MTIGVPDVPATRRWDPWGDHYLINEWRANGVPETTLNFVIQGLEFKPNGPGLTGHQITPGIAHIDGYRVKYTNNPPVNIDFAADTYNRLYAVLNLDPDVEAGYENAYITIQKVVGLNSEPPTYPHVLLGIIRTQSGIPNLPFSWIYWIDNFPQAPEILVASGDVKKSFGYFDRPLLNIPRALPSILVPLFYYKLDEGVTSDCLSYFGTDDIIIPDPVNPYARPVRGRIGKGQLFDQNFISQAYRKSVNPTGITTNLDVFDDCYFFQIWAYPQRDDVDQTLLFKSGDMLLFWNATTKKLRFQAGDGLGSLVRYVDSAVIDPFKDKWFHICFGYDNVLDKHWIIVNNGTRELEIAVGGTIGGAATDFYMGADWPITTPFYGILDEFARFKNNNPFYRHEIEQLWNFGVGNPFNTSIDSEPKVLVEGYLQNAAVGSGAQVKLTAGSITGDGARYYSLSTNQFIDKGAPGIYLCHVRIGIDAAPADRLFRIGFKSGGAWIEFEELQSSINDDLSLSCTAIIPTGVSPEIEMWFFNPGGTGINLQGGASYSEFFIMKLR